MMKINRKMGKKRDSYGKINGLKELFYGTFRLVKLEIFGQNVEKSGFFGGKKLWKKGNYWFFENKKLKKAKNQ